MHIHMHMQHPVQTILTLANALEYGHVPPSRHMRDRGDGVPVDFAVHYGDDDEACVSPSVSNRHGTNTLYLAPEVMTWLMQEKARYQTGFHVSHVVPCTLRLIGHDRDFYRLRVTRGLGRHHTWFVPATHANVFAMNDGFRNRFRRLLAVRRDWRRFIRARDHMRAYVGASRILRSVGCGAPELAKLIADETCRHRYS